MKIDKKVLMIIAAVIVVILGLYFLNKWREERALQQALKDVYGIDTKNTDIEALKTPEQIFTETKEASLAGKISSMFTNDVKPEVGKIFGNAKTTSYGRGYTDYDGSFVAGFMVSRIISAADLAKLEADYSQKGFETQLNEVSANAGSLTMAKTDGETVAFSYEGTDSQDLVVWYTPAPPAE